jgi:hypothetical protein
MQGGEEACSEGLQISLACHQQSARSVAQMEVYFCSSETIQEQTYMKVSSHHVLLPAEISCNSALSTLTLFFSSQFISIELLLLYHGIAAISRTLTQNRDTVCCGFFSLSSHYLGVRIKSGNCTFSNVALSKKN